MKKYSFKRMFAVLVCLVVFVISLPTIPSKAFANNITTDPQPVNPNANQTCRNFYQYLINVGRGDAVISGAYSQKYDVVSSERDYWRYIQEYFGVTPTIYSAGSPEYRPTYTDPIREEAIKRYKEGAVPLFMLQDLGYAITKYRFEKNAANGIMNFDATNPDRDMDMYNDFRQTLKQVADGFEELEKNGVEVYMARIWGENNSSIWNGFFGVNKEGYQAFKNVWAQMCDYFFNERKLTGLLIIYAPMGLADSANYYPGDDYVDINGPTVYSNTGNGALYHTDAVDYKWMKNCKRPFAISEGGPREAMVTLAGPIGDWKLYLESALYTFPETCFIAVWNTDYQTLAPTKGESVKGNYNGDYFIYNEKVINADEMPDYRNPDVIIESTGNASLYTEKDLKGTASYLAEGEYTAATLENKGISLKTIKSANVLFGKGLIFYEEDNFGGKSYLVTGANDEISDITFKSKSLKVVTLDNLSYYKDIWTDNGDDAILKANDGTTNRCMLSATNADNTMDITIDLGGEYAVSQMSVDTAGVFENSNYNVRDFEIQVSTDGITYTPVYKIIGNSRNSVNASFEAVKARYVKLKVLTPNSSTSEFDRNKISLSEITVYGTNIGTLVLDEASEENAVIVLPSTDANIDNTVENTTSADSTNSITKPLDTVPETDKPSTASKIIIPEFYNYVWIIFCAAILLIVAVFWLIAFLRNSKRK